MKRTFIALDCHAENSLKNAVDEIKTILRGEQIKWVDITHFHITLAFLGDTDNTSVGRVKDMLKSAANSIAPFTINIKGIGVFKNIHDPRVIWAGVEKNENMHQLYRAITEGLKFMDYKPDHHFSPHLTLGRVKMLQNKQNLKLVLNKFETSFFQQSKIDELVYYESALTPRGPVYTPLLKVSLR